MCGERRAQRTRARRRIAVQPRVCGERSVRSCDRLGGCRFSPACAGNGIGSPGLERLIEPVQPRVCGERNSTSAISSSAIAVQPRVCGERHGISASPIVDGSAPRVRGTGWLELIVRSRIAVQPRVCGERAIAVPNQGRDAVQPRVCGERLRGQLDAMLAVQPRVCGERLLANRRSRCPSRFIPACAGNVPSMA